MVAEDALRDAFVDELHDLVDDGRAIRTTINQVAKKYKVTATCCVAVSIVAEPFEQLLQHLRFTVNIADNIQRPIGKISNNGQFQSPPCKCCARDPMLSIRLTRSSMAASGVSLLGQSIMQRL